MWISSFSRGFEKDPRKSKFEMYARIPVLHLTGKFNAEGQLLNFPVKANGVYDVSMENVKIGFRFKPKFTVKDDQTYLSVDKMKTLVEPERWVLALCWFLCWISVRSLKMNLKGSLNESDTLNASLNEFLNSNWKDLWKQLYPDFSSSLSSIQKDFIDSIFKSFAYETMYLNWNQV